MNKLEDFIFPTQEELFKALKKEVEGKKVIVNGKYILVIGDAPIMLLAHLDTVHKDRVTVICKSNDGNILMSPQGIGGDDRCGVYALVTAYRASFFKPWLLFTCDEEIGGKGAEAFAYDYENGKLPKKLEGIKYLIEIDRKGNNDAVYYDCANDEFEDYITGFGFKTASGSYSDICDVAPALGVAAVNLSSGYYQAHTQHEYINRKELNAVVQTVIRMIGESLDSDVPQFDWIERPYRYSKVGYRYYYEQCNWKEVLKEDEVPQDVPAQYVLAYEDLLDVYTVDEIEQVRQAYGNEAIYELYEDAFGPFTNSTGVEQIIS